MDAEAGKGVGRVLKVQAMRMRFVPRRGALDEMRFWGSAWRGAFGWALKREVCVFDARRTRCARCVLRTGCAYARLFEGMQPTSARGRVAPYALFAEAKDGRMQVELALFAPEAGDWRGALARALVRAGEKGVAGVRFALSEVAWLGGEGRWTPEPAAGWVPEAQSEGRVRVVMRSPLRCKRNGRLAGPGEMTPALWFAALRRRVVALAEGIGEGARVREVLAGISMPEWREASWRWKELGRYSNRQQAAMKIGGVLGSFAVEARGALATLLALGRFTHMGKLASMGLGRYALQWEGSA